MKHGKKTSQKKEESLNSYSNKEQVDQTHIASNCRPRQMILNAQKQHKIINKEMP